MSFYGNLVCAVLVAAIAAASYIAGDTNRAKLDAGKQAKRDLETATQAASAYKELEERYRAKEQAQAQQIAAVSKDYQKRIAANETQRLADIAALDARTIVLRDPNANNQACGSQAPAVAPGTSGSNGGQGGELSAATSRFLLREASRADAVVSQLQACQAILQSERQ